MTGVKMTTNVVSNAVRILLMKTSLNPGVISEHLEIIIASHIYYLPQVGNSLFRAVQPHLNIQSSSSFPD